MVARDGSHPARSATPAAAPRAGWNSWAASRARADRSRARRGRLTASGSSFIARPRRNGRRHARSTAAIRRFASSEPGIFPSYTPDGTAPDQRHRHSGPGAQRHSVDAARMARTASVIFDDAEKSAVAAVYSPTGDRIAFGLGAFFGGMIGRPATVSNLALVNADGSGLQLLTTGDVNDGFPSWSPDGRQIVFRSAGTNGKGLRILDVATRQTRVLTDGPYTDNFPSWSPDGSTIAFTRNMQGNYDIFTIHPDGSALRRLTTDPGQRGALHVVAGWTVDRLRQRAGGVQGRDGAACRESAILWRDLRHASRRLRRAVPHRQPVRRCHPVVAALAGTGEVAAGAVGLHHNIIQTD